MASEYGLAAGVSQQANPYKRKGQDTYQDEARQRALSTAVQGGAQPQQSDTNANQPGGYDEYRQNRGRQYDYGAQSRRRIDLGDGGGDSASGRLGHSPYEQGGVTGGAAARQARQQAPADEYAQTPPEQPTPPPTVDYKTMGQYGNKLGGYAAEKFQRPWDDMSEKYQIGTVLSHFDPKGGISPEVLAALNQANIHGAKFSGSGDKLTVDNVTGYDRFGTGGTADVIKGLKGQNEDTNWGAWFVDPNDPGGGGGGGMGQQQALAQAIAGGTYGGSSGYPWMSRNTQTGGDALQMIYQILNPLLAQSGLGGGGGNALAALLGSGGGV